MYTLDYYWLLLFYVDTSYFFLIIIYFLSFFLVWKWSDPWLKNRDTIQTVSFVISSTPSSRGLCSRYPAQTPLIHIIWTAPLNTWRVPEESSGQLWSPDVSVSCIEDVSRRRQLFSHFSWNTPLALCFYKELCVLQFKYFKICTKLYMQNMHIQYDIHTFDCFL